MPYCPTEVEVPTPKCAGKCSGGAFHRCADEAEDNVTF